jgi:hypothetical protein
LVNLTDFYSFGAPMPGRNFNSNTYRYGFNSGSEKDDEITGVTGAHYTTEWRELDTRLGGRWWSPDRIVKPWESPYAGFANNPIYFSDPSGLDPTDDKKPQGNSQNTTGTWETKNPDGSYTGKEAPPTTLPEVEVCGNCNEPAPTVTAENTTKGAAVPAAQLWRDGAIRNNYYRPMVNDFKQLYQAGKLSDGTYSMLRYQAQKATKMKLSTMGQAMSEASPFGKPLAQQKALAEGVANGTIGMPKGAMSTRGSTTKIATAAQIGGKVLVVAGAAMSIHHVITADDKGLAISQEAGGYTGAWAGAEAGATVGLFFGPFAPIASPVLGLAGGIGGYFYGYNKGGEIYQELKK